MSKELLSGLHENLWQSLRHIFNTDRVMLGVAYLVNFAGFVLFLSLLPENVPATAIAFFCLFALNALIIISIANSKKEVDSIVRTLVAIYEDEQLSKYFDERKKDYYSRRYKLWLVLIPALFVFASVVSVAIEYLA